MRGTMYRDGEIVEMGVNGGNSEGEQRREWRGQDRIEGIVVVQKG